MDPQQPDPASAAALAGLAREVEGLRRVLDPLTELPARVDDLASLVTQALEDLAIGATRAGPVVAPSWLDLPPDPGVVARVLGELIDWMGRVYLRYRDAAASFPSCWLWHPDVVEELLWLRHAWHGAYHDTTATAQMAGDWHDRLRPGVVRRIKTAAGDCDTTLHTPPHRLTPVPLTNAAELITGWWATNRDHPAPEPTAEHLDAAVEHFTTTMHRPGSHR